MALTGDGDLMQAVIHKAATYAQFQRAQRLVDSWRAWPATSLLCALL